MNDIENGRKYISALEKIKSDEISVLQSAITEFSSISGYRDADQRIIYCKEKIKLLENTKKKKKSTKGFIVLGVLVCIAAGAAGLFINRTIQDRKLDDLHIQHYNNAISYLSNNQYQEAALEFGKAGDYEDAQSRSLTLWRDLIKTTTISIGSFTMNNHIVAVKSDGTAVATGRSYDGQCDVSEWSDLISISAGGSHTVGLRADGTVVATGSNTDGQCDVSKWKDIVCIGTGFDYTAGLKSDGSVVIAGRVSYNEASEWMDKINNIGNIVNIWVGDSSLIGITLDGEIVVAGDELFFDEGIMHWEKNGDSEEVVEDDNYGPIRQWTDIKQMAEGSGDVQIIGLKTDGTLCAAGWNDNGQCNISEWTDITSIAAGLRITVGLKSDGTVICTGSNEEGQAEVSTWTDIVAIDSDCRQTLGLKSDGTVLLVGDIGSWDIDVSGWNDIMIP